MKKANVEGLEKMAAGYLQHRYSYFLRVKPDFEDKVPAILRAYGREVPAKELYDTYNVYALCHAYSVYSGACEMIEAFGGEWKRIYSGDDSKEAKRDIKNYRHIVIFPNDETCKRLNFNAWED
jgi:hypothetical protein